MDSACSLTIRMVTDSLCGIKLSLCFLGILASLIPERYHKVCPHVIETS
jgi:hypothetical protein